jgi:hypothetical protein
MLPDEESQPLGWLEDFWEEGLLDGGAPLGVPSDSLVLSASSSGGPARRVGSALLSDAVWHRGQTASPALSGVAQSGHVGTGAL